MKNTFILILALLSFIQNSCKKPECPVPGIKVPSLVLKTATLPNDAASVKDAYVANSNGGNGNTGSKNFLDTRAWTISSVSGVWRTFLDFDYSSVPADAEIIKATLTLYADTTFVEQEAMPQGHSTLSGSNAFYLKRITQSWGETTVTWNTAPATDNVNQISLPASTSVSQAYIIDVTNLVKDEFSSPNSFHGFLIQLQNETPYRSVTFFSSDCPYPKVRPKMEIEYKVMQ